MRRAYLLIVIPAAVVGIFYVGVFRFMGYDITPAPFLGAVACFVIALLAVRYFQKRRVRGSGGGSHGRH